MNFPLNFPNFIRHFDIKNEKKEKKKHIFILKQTTPNINIE